jgi:hypothetical protein
VHFDGLSFRMSFPVGSGYRTSPDSHIFVDLSVHASDLPHLLITGIFMLFSFIPVTIHEI